MANGTSEKSKVTKKKTLKVSGPKKGKKSSAILEVESAERGAGQSGSDRPKGQSAQEG